MALGEVLKANDIKQRDLATALDVREETVSRWVNGENLPDGPNAGRLLAFLRDRTGEDVTFEQLFGATTLPPTPSDPALPVAAND
jgi:transcriptional regulator with XRE-family HTH domain